jgi:plastocyanin
VRAWWSLATAHDESWDTGTIEPGESATVTVEEAGTFAYHCSFHPSMTATITVSCRPVIAGRS